MNVTRPAAIALSTLALAFLSLTACSSNDDDMTPAPTMSDDSMMSTTPSPMMSEESTKDETPGMMSETPKMGDGAMMSTTSP